MNTKKVAVKLPSEWGKRKTMTICSVVALAPQAELAEKLLFQLAIAAANPDGEDSAGRQKLRLLTADEVALRACQISEAVWKEFEKRDWLTEVPLPDADELNDKI